MTKASLHQSILFVDDPNSVNINMDIANAIPDYQDMHIYAELTAVRKARTVISNTGNEGAIESEDTFKVNFIGVNQTEDNPNFMRFTSNYYDGSTSPNENQMESFGITSIKVTINSSYVPQVNIEFVDLRGLSFFNQNDSPYRILFDFPPPTFNLKIKGYYGRTLSYDLHLVKYNTEFVSSNGNFVIDAQFVALTFAPLTDILFRYITNMPLILNETSSINSDTEAPPTNTFDLILKLQNLYTVTNELLDKSEEKKELNDSISELSEIESAVEILKNSNEFLKDYGTPVIMKKDVNLLYNPSIPLQNYAGTNFYDTITILKNISDYNGEIKNMLKDVDVDSISTRLYVGYIVTKNNTSQDKSLVEYKNKLISAAGSIVKNSDIGIPVSINSGNNSNTGTTNNNPNYYVIDITNYYVKLFRKKTQINEKRQISSRKINSLINNSILKNLGMMPTIYNIFKLILDDVDKFFNILRKTANDAEEHHDKFLEEIFDAIADNDRTNSSKKVYAFPLIIKDEDVESNNFRRKVRTSPNDINKKITERFPESILIDNFIETFKSQKQLLFDFKVRSTTNNDGSAKWIPISPLDSSLGDVSPVTPYAGRINNIDNILETLLNRFYILSQNSFPSDFYNKNNEIISKSFMDLYSYAEALNISLSVNNKIDAKNILDFAKKFDSTSKVNNGFYKYLEKYIYNYQFLNDNKAIGNFYVDKNDVNYVGSVIYSPNITLQNIPEDEDNPLYVFMKDVKEKKKKKLFFWNNTKLPESQYLFTNENVLYFKDVFGEEDSKKNKLNLSTKYVTDITKFVDISKSTIPSIISGGNVKVKSGQPKVSLTNEKCFKNVPELWANTLAINDIAIANDVIKNPSHLSAILLLSNFGLTLSPFNIYPNELNENIFLTPSAVETPSFLPLYIGSLVDADTNGMLTQLETFFKSGGTNISSKGILIFADIHDINTYLSEKDKAHYKKLYTDFYNGNNYNSGSDYNQIRTALNELYNIVYNNNDSVQKMREYQKYLNPLNSEYNDKSDYFNRILSPLLDKRNFIIHSEISFLMSLTNNNEYKTLKTMNSDSFILNKNNQFFSNFFNKLIMILKNKEKELQEEEEELIRIGGDEDIITQMYYSFKNINDKWLTNPNRNFGGDGGYPNNKSNKKLIDSFVFIDRAMNPVGDTIINPEVLLTLFEDTNVSVFSVLAQLLSMNGFEFFPLQNFMLQDMNSWSDSFKIDSEGYIDQRESFICMFIGGTSSYPSNLIGNGFFNDGITDLITSIPIDFNSPPDNNTLEDSTNFKYKTVRAFRVKFGEQNQSMFTDIKIDSKEFPETNESLQILSRLAGDEGAGQPTPKGQNLYNLYENRAYSATVTGLGNAMIQPTQYFQLDNIPLFNGAYLILSVEHNITANKMMTSFTGTKILKYPIPRVLNPAAIIGFEGGSSDVTDWNFSNEKTPMNKNKNNNILYPDVYNKFINPELQINSPIDANRVYCSGIYNRTPDKMPNEYGRHHLGVDFATTQNLEIWAVADGTIVQMERWKTGDKIGYGNIMIIKHENNNFSAYAHLHSFHETYKVGDPVKAGDLIGWCGKTGGDYGVHLHFEYRIGAGGGAIGGDDDYAVDPRPYLEQSMKSVWDRYDHVTA